MQLDDLHIALNGRQPVAGVTLQLAAGEIVALVGASGSGKTLCARAMMGLLPPGACISHGSLCWRGQPLTHYTEAQWRRLRGKEIAMIFQDPMSTLNPVLRIDTQLMEAVQAHRRISRHEAGQLALQALEQVGMPQARERLRAWPHQLSGGMRQRVAIAMALINRPALIIADEATTALDVTLQSQILQLMQHHCRHSGSSLLWISHDLTVVAGLADRIAVMQAGRIVECGPTRQLIDQPQHAYTRALLHALPRAQRS